MAVRKTQAVSCPFCKNRYVNEGSLRSHIERSHEDQLHGLSAANVLFNIRNGKTGGQCIMCRRPSSFNEVTGKYNRLCTDPQCKKRYVEMFRQRMMKTYGKVHLLDDPEQQKNMLAQRKISETYTWDKYQFTVTGTYERDWIEYLRYGLNWDPEDLVMPCPFIITYMYVGETHSYIPDAYIPSLNLVVEIKGSNNHYQSRDINKERAKDQAAEKSPYNYCKIMDKHYDEFTEDIRSGRWVQSKSGKDKRFDTSTARTQRIIALGEAYAVSPGEILSTLTPLTQG